MAQSQFETAVEAVINGDAALLRDLLEGNPRLATAHSSRDHRATLLHYVAANGVEDERQKTPANCLEIARILLEAGADPNATTNIYGGGNESTPLVALVSSAHPARAGVQEALTKLFCEFGAKVNGLDDDGLPLATAIAFRYIDTAQMLAACGARVDNIVFAAALGDLEKVQHFFKGTLKPYKDPFKRVLHERERILGTALVAACSADERPIVMYLLENGVDVNAHSVIENSTGLHEAARYNLPELASLLLEHGADVAVKDRDGFTPLHWAAWHGKNQMIDLLLSRNAPLEAVNNYGGTVLDSTIWGFRNTRYPPQNYLHIIEHLLSAGADADVVSPFPTGDDAIDDLLRPHRKGQPT